ncbi:MAG: hypothetical protein HY557_02900 [Euryarchaeota archaeon]|nr:hypothetical protein [Euryarchaeota archaeon]
MTDVTKIDLKLKRLVAIEADHRATIKRAEEDKRRDPERKERYVRIVEKNRRKVDKLLPKIRRLRELRAAMR